MKKQPKPPRVRLGRYPRWLVPRIRQAIRSGRLTVHWSVRSCPRAELVHRVFKQSRPLWDHWGTVGERLVSEPYAMPADYLEILEAARAFAEALGLEFVVSARSSWNEWTIRLEFWIAEGKG